MPTGIYKRKTLKEGKKYTILPKICLTLPNLTMEEKQEIAIWFKNLSYRDRKFVRELVNIEENY